MTTLANLDEPHLSPPYLGEGVVGGEATIPVKYLLKRWSTSLVTAACTRYKIETSSDFSISKSSPAGLLH